MSKRKCRDGGEMNGQSVLITNTVKTRQFVLLDSGACRHWQPTEKMSSVAGENHGRGKLLLPFSRFSLLS